MAPSSAQPNPPLRVLFDAEVLKPIKTGVEHYAAELLIAMAQRSDVSLTALRRPGRPGEEPIALPVPSEAPPASLLGRWLGRDGSWQAFDVIHCPTVRLPFVCKPAGVRLVVTVHDLVPLVMPEHHDRKHRLYFRWALPRLLKLADRLITVSESTKRDTVRLLNVPAERIDVVPLGVRWPVVDAPVEPKADYFLAVGTLEPRKNLEAVVEAFVRLKRGQPELTCRLVVAGKVGWGKSSVVDEIGRRDDIDWLGYVGDDQLRPLYERARAMVYPSLYEGFGLPVLEAMASGCPVITSRRASLPEVGGEAVLYTEPTDPGQIAEAMHQVLSAEPLARRLARQGAARARQFSWQRTAEQTVAVYHKALARPATPGRST